MRSDSGGLVLSAIVIEFILKWITYISISILILLVFLGILDFIFLLLDKQFPPKRFRNFYKRKIKKVNGNKKKMKRKN